MKRAAMLVLLIALLACDRSRSAPADSGIEGAVLIGPTCPVVQISSPCPDQPFKARLRIVALPSEEVITTIETGPDGRFKIELGAGRYRIEPVLEKSPPSGAPTEVEVRAHEFSTITITLDSGIR